MGGVGALARKIVYLDANVFVYAVEGFAEHVRRSARRVRRRGCGSTSARSSIVGPPKLLVVAEQHGATDRDGGSDMDGVGELDPEVGTMAGRAGENRPIDRHDVQMLRARQQLLVDGGNVVSGLERRDHPPASVTSLVTSVASPTSMLRNSSSMNAWSALPSWRCGVIYVMYVTH